MASSDPCNYDYLSDHDTIMESLVALAPSNVSSNASNSGKSGRLSVRDVIRTFEWSESARYNIDKLASIHKISLINALQFLNIKHYNKMLDIQKMRSCEKNVIATLIFNKMKSLLPQFCPNCNAHFAVPFHDIYQDRLFYCHSCSTPSHDCYTWTHPNIPSSPLVWLCDDCSHDLSSTVTKHLDFPPTLRPCTTIPPKIPSCPPPPPPPPPIATCPTPSDKSLNPSVPDNPAENHSPSPQPETSSSIPPSISPTTVMEPPSPQSTHTKATPQLTPPTKNAVPKICHFLQKGICR